MNGNDHYFNSYYCFYHFYNFLVSLSTVPSQNSQDVRILNVFIDICLWPTITRVYTGERKHKTVEQIKSNVAGENTTTAKMEQLNPNVFHIALQCTGNLCCSIGWSLDYIYVNVSTSCSFKDHDEPRSAVW